jgi:hypothetical protein
LLNIAKAFAGHFLPNIAVIFSTFRIDFLSFFDSRTAGLVGDSHRLPVLCLYGLMMANNILTKNLIV